MKAAVDTAPRQAFADALLARARGVPAAGRAPRGDWLMQEALACFVRAGLPGGWGGPDDVARARRRAWLERALGFVPDIWPLVGTCRVAWLGRRWEPVPDDDMERERFGCPAIVVPALLGHAAVDLVALPVIDGAIDPARWYLRTGDADTLGFVPGDPARDNADTGQPVRLARTPLAWLRAWASVADKETGAWPRHPPACCLLGEPVDLASTHLLLEARVVCDDEAHAAEIHGLRQEHLKQMRAHILPTRRGAVTSIMVV
jgi:hypothetical protein